MNDVEQFSPDRIADRLVIQHLMYRWCRAVDRLDREGMLSVFHRSGWQRFPPLRAPQPHLVS